MSKSIYVAASIAFASCMAQAAPEPMTTLKDQQEVAVTIYNENLALVKDARKVKMQAGESKLAWRDVSRACVQRLRYCVISRILKAYL